MKLFGDGFSERRVHIDGTGIHLVTGGSGPPLLLLHGYPQTHSMWHKIAPLLAHNFTLVMPDLRGYGDSDKPESDDAHIAYSKRVMAAEQAAVMAELGFDSFFLAGHDRGGRVSYRMALDHPERVLRLAVLDIVPTLEQFERINKSTALGSFHWYFLAQPAPFPEHMIGHDPDTWLRNCLRNWSGDTDAFDSGAVEEYLRCFRDPEVIHATCEDYRAGAFVDSDLDAADREAGRHIACPVLALWGGGSKSRLHKRQAILEIWSSWAENVSGHGLDCGHFLPEENPQETATALASFFSGD